MTKRTMRRLPVQLMGLLCVGLLMASGPASAADQAASMEPATKVVIQVSTADRTTQKVALNNAANLQKALGMNNVRVEIVAYGPGLSLLMADSPYSERVTSMSMEDIRFSACHNTMMGFKRKHGHMPELAEGVQVVPSGVARIVKLQQRGYQYVRP